MKRQKEIFKLIYSLFPEEPLERQVLVIIYEVGDLARCIQRITIPSISDAEKRAYRAEAMKAIADAITQLRLTCERLGLSFEEVDDFGFEALKEKMAELRKRRGSRL